LYEKGARTSLLSSIFSAIEASAHTVPGMEPGAQDLNEALVELLGKGRIDVALMKKLWKQMMQVLAQTSLQPGLAMAVASSITENVAFLPKAELEMTLSAARNYPVLAYAVEGHSMMAFRRAWNALQDGKLSTSEFNVRRKRFF